MSPACLYLSIRLNRRVGFSCCLMMLLPAAPLNTHKHTQPHPNTPPPTHTHISTREHRRTHTHTHTFIHTNTHKLIHTCAHTTSSHHTYCMNTHIITPHI